jgi:hypothetical protein
LQSSMHSNSERLKFITQNLAYVYLSPFASPFLILILKLLLAI